MKIIGQLSESSLHAALKEFYVRPGDPVEQCVDGYIVDVLRGSQIVEIQTGSFSGLKSKLKHLSLRYSFLIAYPVSVERTLVRIDNATGEMLSKRRSPRKAKPEEIFSELVYIIPSLVGATISFDIIKVRDEVLLINDGRGSWRRKFWSIYDRKLLGIESTVHVISVLDLKKFLPPDMPDAFTSKDVSDFGKIPDRLARKMVYCLFHLKLIERVGKKGNSWVYRK